MTTSKQYLPTVTQDTIGSVIASTENQDQVTEWVAKLCRENPSVVFAVDSMNNGSPSLLLVAAMVYKLLDSQTEADQMNADFGDGQN